MRQGRPKGCIMQTIIKLDSERKREESHQIILQQQIAMASLVSRFKRM